MKTKNWKFINFQKLPKDVIKFTYIGRVFYVSEHRTSYHGYGSDNYFREDSFYPTFNDAIKFVEEKRKMGSYFRITEIPAIVVEGSNYSICLISSQLGHPFNTHIDLSLKHKILSNIVKDFYSHSKYQTYIFKCDLKSINFFDSPLGKYTSINNGSGYKFGWEKSNNKQKNNMDEVFSISKNIFQLIE